MSKLRVHDMAGEFGISSDEVISLLRTMDVPVRNHLTLLTDDQVSRIRLRWEREKRARVEKPAAAPARRRRGAAAAAPAAPAPVAPPPAEAAPARRRRKAADVAAAEEAHDRVAAEQAEIIAQAAVVVPEAPPAKPSRVVEADIEEV